MTTTTTSHKMTKQMTVTDDKTDTSSAQDRVHCVSSVEISVLSQYFRCARVDTPEVLRHNAYFYTTTLHVCCWSLAGSYNVTTPTRNESVPKIITNDNNSFS